MSYMKFAEGMILGGLLTLGATMMYNDKMMKKGKKIIKRLGMM